MEQPQMTAMPAATGTTGGGTILGFDKELLWFIFKIVLVIAIIIFGIKYFIDKNKENKAKAKIASAKEKESDSEEETDQEEPEA